MPGKTFRHEEYDLSQIEGRTIGKGYIFNNMEFEHIDTDSASDDCGCKHVCDALQPTPLVTSNKGSQKLALGKRDGSECDVETLTDLFKQMKLEVIKHEDYTKEKFQNTLQDIADKEVGPDDKCIVVAIMSHGNEKKIRLKDAECELDKVFEIINECKNLQGKPKIFFIQACRGNEHNCPETDADPDMFDEKRDKDETQHGTVSEDPLVVPKGSDFLACYATSEGYVSYRYNYGTAFIHEIGIQLREYLKGDYECEDFLSLMTVVVREIARQNFGPAKKHRKQMPTLVTTLRKQLKFPSARIMQAQCDTVCDDAQVREEVKMTSQDDRIKELLERMQEMEAWMMEQQKSQSENPPADSAEKSSN